MGYLWVWLEAGRNAEAVAAITTVITTVVGTLGFIFAARVYRATIRQVDIARQQASAAQRPFLLLDWKIFNSRREGRRRLLVIRNNREGPVTDSYWTHASAGALEPISDRKWVRVGSISKNGSALLRLVDGIHFASTMTAADGILIHYKDLEGTRYYCAASSHRFGIDNENEALPPDAASPLDRVQ